MWIMVRRLLLVLTIVATTGCGGASQDGSGGASVPTSTAASPATPSAPPVGGDTPPDGASNPSCDQSGVRACLLPWPDNRLTVADPTTATGRRLAIPQDAVPVNVDGIPMDVTDQNRADGFSPNSAIVFVADGVDLVRSGVPDSNHVADSLGDDVPVSITDTGSGSPVPFWGEVDPASGLVTIRPAVVLEEGNTYEVEVGALINSDGDDVEVGVTSWDFTVASTESLAGRLLRIRDTAYGLLDEGVPPFTVDSVVGDEVRTVEGTITIANFLDNDGSPGGSLLLDADDLPIVNDGVPAFATPFRCVLPGRVTEPVRTVLYGHGLLGDRSEVDFFGSFAAQGVVAGCAVDWLGMSAGDLGNLALILSDMGRFNQQVDRMLHGHLAFMMLGRLVNDPRGFASDPAFQDEDGSPLLAPDGAVFVGNSQGGILGGAVGAVTDEWTQVVLGVPGINYSLLLPRSVDWPEFQVLFNSAYLDDDDRLMALMLVQLLWDRGENGAYARHLTDAPYPGAVPKNVLLVGAYGDHQVANVSTAILARTIEAGVHTPVMGEGRIPVGDPFWGIDELREWSGSGAALVMWDYGTKAPPTGPVPPNETEHGRDPHGAGSSEPQVLTQALAFLLTNTLLPVCGDGPCVGRPVDGD